MEDLLHVQWMQNIELLPIILGSPGSQQFHLFRHAQMMCLKTACNFSHKIHWHLHTRRSQMLAGCLPSSTLTMSSQAGPQWTGWVLLYFDFGGGVRMCLFVCVCVLVDPRCNFIKPIFFLVQTHFLQYLSMTWKSCWRLTKLSGVDFSSCTGPGCC